MVEIDDTVDFDLVERAGDLEEEASEKDLRFFFKIGDVGVPRPPGGSWLICSSKESSLPNPSESICWSLATTGGNMGFDSLLISDASMLVSTFSFFTSIFKTGSSTI